VLSVTDVSYLRDRPVLSVTDVSYLREGFVSLGELCAQRGADIGEARKLIEQRRLPRPSYILDDGTEMVPPDYFALYDAASVEQIETMFRRRLAARARELGTSCTDSELADEWKAYLSGDYGVCLKEATPENICSKGFHMAAIERLLRAPSPADDQWRESLAANVDALDRLERQFAELDRIRWGPVSRGRLITAARERYPEVFSTRELPRH
jgi:hypothetical protein